MPIQTQFEVHDLAHHFPEMSSLEYEALREDIAENGLQDPITLFEGKILDGRHRYKACCELGIQLRTIDFPGTFEEANKYSAGANLMRRHLSKSQKAMYLVTAGLVPPPGLDGRRRKYGDGDEGGIRELSTRYGVNHMTIYKAAYVFHHDKELAEQVANGSISVGVREGDPGSTWGIGCGTTR